ncbi:hypothetical protein FXO37_10075 [Capsicum annuum]|nr:hypothetical protein FXO37_10075 [Capsicum annuum]
MDSTNQDNDDTIIGVAATSVLATRVAIIVFYEHESNIPREPYVNKDQEREFYMNSILNGSDVHYVGQIRMSKNVFYELSNAFRKSSFLCSTKNMSVQEQVLIFLEIVGFNERFQKIGSHFYRSIKSIHRCFHTMLQVVLKLYPILIKSSDETVQPEIMNNHRYYPWFTFTYVLAGWEGSAHDSRILNDALERPHGLQIPQGPSIEKDVQATEVSQIKASRKRKHSFEMQDIVGDISIKFGEVATTIGRMIDSRLNVTKLYEEVMAMEGYNEDFLSDAFDYSMTHLLESTTQPLKLIPTDESPVANQQLQVLYYATQIPTSESSVGINFRFYYNSSSANNNNNSQQEKDDDDNEEEDDDNEEEDDE